MKFKFMIGQAQDFFMVTGHCYYFSFVVDYKFVLKGYHGERRGEREDMQDAHTMIDDFTPQFESLPNSM